VERKRDGDGRWPFENAYAREAQFDREDNAAVSVGKKALTPIIRDFVLPSRR
jgi:hypothetical protein